MITPIRKPECRDLLDWQKEFNTQVNKVRYMIEQVIANFKTWRIMHTDYRRPLDTCDTTISAVVGLHFYSMARISLISLYFLELIFRKDLLGPPRGRRR